MRRALLYLALSACGRIDFAERPDAGPDALACGNAVCLDLAFDDDGETSIDDGLAVDASGHPHRRRPVRTTATGFDLLVARLLPTAAADPTFNAGMLLQLDLFGGDELGALASLGPNGTTYLVGQAFRGAASFDGVLVRLLSDGTRDPTYGANGVATLDLGGTERFFDAAVAPDGSSVAVGLADTDILVMRLFFR